MKKRKSITKIFLPALASTVLLELRVRCGSFGPGSGLDLSSKSRCIVVTHEDDGVGIRIGINSHIKSKSHQIKLKLLQQSSTIYYIHTPFLQPGELQDDFEERISAIMDRTGFRLGVFVFILQMAFFSAGTRVVCGFVPELAVSDRFGGRSQCVSESPSMNVDIQTRHNNQFLLLAAQSDNNDSESTTPSSPRVKFSDDGSSSSLDNPLDQFLTFVASDAFSVVAGIIGLLAVVVHRWNLVLASDPTRATAEALTYQTRTDLLGVLASGSVLLNGVTKLDVTTALAESVVLEGTVLSEPEHTITTAGTTNTLTWAMESLLAATPAKTAVLVTDAGEEDGWTIQCRAGVVPSSTSIPERTPILERVGNPENSKETYLPTLQALPGRTELTYLPNNTQMAVMIPIQSSSSSSSSKKNHVLVLGGNTAKSFTPRDIAWSRIVAQKLGEDL